MEIQAATVTELITQIKTTLEYEYSDVTVIGEISNLSPSGAGHYYFTLSDKDSSVSCAVFRMDALRNPLIRKLKNGDKIYLRGPISLYAKRGTFQIIGKKILPYGQGDLKAQFEFLKEKLKAQGLFDLDRKKQIPVFPKKVAILTAQNGAALQDFLNVMKRRSLWYDLLIFPSLVQGDNCPKSLIKNLKLIEQRSDIDLVVLTRGGGSMEDLWGFNDEALVRMLAEFPIPTISAVGHQVDYTLSDFVCDMRCETPTAAAEIISQPQTELKQRMSHLLTTLKAEFGDFQRKTLKRIQRINPTRARHIIQDKIYQAQGRINKFKVLERIDFTRLYGHRQNLDDLIEKSKRNIENQLVLYKQRVGAADQLLNGLSPYRVLERGYSFVQDENHNVVDSSKYFDSLENQVLSIRFKDGERKVKKA